MAFDKFEGILPSLSLLIKKNLFHMEKIFKSLNILQVLSFVILFGMAISALVITRNVNEEFKIREIAGNLQKYKYATLSFNNIYNGLPGDLEKATFYWKDETADGNGDRRISHQDREGILAWQHMQLAGLLEFKTNLSGKWADGKENILVSDYNVPLEKLHNGIFYFDNNLMENFNYIGYASPSNEPGISIDAVLTPEELTKLDFIVDDGYPETGILKAISKDSSKCYLSGEYKQEKELVECALAYKI